MRFNPVFFRIKFPDNLWRWIVFITILCLTRSSLGFFQSTLRIPNISVTEKIVNAIHYKDEAKRRNIFLQQLHVVFFPI